MGILVVLPTVQNQNYQSINLTVNQFFNPNSNFKASTANIQPNNYYVAHTAIV